MKVHSFNCFVFTNGTIYFYNFEFTKNYKNKLWSESTFYSTAGYLFIHLQILLQRHPIIH